MLQEKTKGSADENTEEEEVAEDKKKVAEDEVD